MLLPPEDRAALQRPRAPPRSRRAQRTRRGRCRRGTPGTRPQSRGLRCHEMASQAARTESEASSACPAGAIPRPAHPHASPTNRAQMEGKKTGVRARDTALQCPAIPPPRPALPSSFTPRIVQRTSPLPPQGGGHCARPRSLGRARTGARSRASERALQPEPTTPPKKKKRGIRRPCSPRASPRRRPPARAAPRTYRATWGGWGRTSPRPPSWPGPGGG